MATIDQMPPVVNGNHGPNSQHRGNPEPQMSPPTQGATTGHNGPTPSNAGSQASTVAESTAGNEPPTDIPNEEVTWAFIKRYYLTLGRQPENLHLFYFKKSQFVFGEEAEKVNISVGRADIAARIKELDLEDCKVRVTNVDFQPSFSNILIQAIGELSNRSRPYRKFVQTFILARQPNGWFVLNDIFRYLDDEIEEEEPAEPEPEPSKAHETSLDSGHAAPKQAKALTSSDDPAEQQRDAELVNKKLEEKAPEHVKVPDTIEDGSLSTPKTNGVAGSTEEVAQIPAQQEDISSGGQAEADVLSHEEAVAAVAAEEETPEKPKDPEPTPAISPPPVVPEKQNQPPIVAKPQVPKSWASLVAAPQLKPASESAPPPSISPASSRPRATPPQSQPLDSSSTPTQPQQSSNQNPGWETAGNEHAKKQSRPLSISEKGNVMAYVKYVTEKVDREELKNALSKFGELAYFDISRPKNCAFVEFATTAGYNAAVAANPHHIGGEAIYVEERRPRSTAYGPQGYGQGRGGRGGRGGYQKSVGGAGYSTRGRGGNVTARGRGGPHES